MATGHEHTVKAFDQDIGQLRALISQMGGLAEQAIADAMAALVRRDLDLASAVIASAMAASARPPISAISARSSPISLSNALTVWSDMALTPNNPGVSRSGR